MTRQLLLRRILPILYALAIITLSSMPNAQPPSFEIPNIDKFYHCLEYFIFGCLVFRAFPGIEASRKRIWLYLLLFAFGLAYAGLDETVQSFVPNRDSSLGDWLADATGYCLAGICVVAFRARRRHNDVDAEHRAQPAAPEEEWR
ncbi:MAG: VanZ family protein [candidate division Zixibacteria bacterium]|nr:VanZ family protein [candidate division Zixibacteria bacterium]